ncbi:MAG: DUF4358 domain-containing protein [Huintestinicola sp.]
MTLKKIAAIAAVLAISSSMLAGCGKNNAAEETQPETSIETSAEVSDEVSEEEVEEDVIPDETDISIMDDTLTDDESDENGEVPAEEAPAEEETAENPLAPMAAAAMADNEWPVLEEVNDETILKEFFLLDAADENYEELLVMSCPISAKMTEIIIIKTKDVEAAVEAVEARRTKAIEQDAWYPNDQELAAASIAGSHGSYAYYFIGDHAAEAEEKLKAYIDANG